MPSWRNRSGEGHGCTERWVLDGQLGSVQGDSPRKFAGRSILAVSDDGVAMIGKLQSDLVLAAGSQVDFE